MLQLVALTCVYVLATDRIARVIAALVSRQYMDMSRIRIEGLLAAFPKLVGAGKQHTYVETENVRYVFQPMEVRLLSTGCEGVLIMYYLPR